jgi:hypothetical protein
MSKHAKRTTPIEEPDFFADLEPAEHRTFRDYLFSQEIVRQERIVRRALQTNQCTDTVPGLVHPDELKTIIRTLRPENWLLSRVAMIRKAWGVNRTFITQIAQTPIWFACPATRLVVLWPEWPKKRYFEIPRDERLRRIEAFQALNEVDRLAALAHLINPHNPSTKKKGILPIAILASETLQAQLDAYVALLRIHAPELFGGAKAPQAKKQGRKSEEARIFDDLSAYAAHELCRTRKLPRKRVLKLICYPKGHKYVGRQIYTNENELNRPLRRFPRHLGEFRDDLIINLTPLESLQKLGPQSEPDWTLLEQAIAEHPEHWEGSPSNIKDLEKLLKRFKNMIAP